MSQVIQHFHNDSIEGLNSIASHLLDVSYHYLNAAFFFDRHDVAHKNLHTFFMNLSEKKRVQADKILKYINTRGGRIQFRDINKPTTVQFSNVISCFDCSIEMEKTFNSALLKLSKTANDVHDPQFADFIDSFLGTQVDDINELGRLKTEAKLAGTGFGEFFFAQEFSEGTMA